MSKWDILDSEEGSLVIEDGESQGIFTVSSQEEAQDLVDTLEEFFTIPSRDISKGNQMTTEEELIEVIKYIDHLTKEFPVVVVKYPEDPLVTRMVEVKQVIKQTMKRLDIE